MLTRNADEVKRIRASALIDSNTTKCIKPTIPRKEQPTCAAEDRDSSQRHLTVGIERRDGLR